MKYSYKDKILYKYPNDTWEILDMTQYLFPPTIKNEQAYFVLNLESGLIYKDRDGAAGQHLKEFALNAYRSLYLYRDIHFDEELFNI